MRQQIHAGTAGSHTTGTSLSSLINRLATPCLSVATRSKTVLRNEIPTDFLTSAEEGRIGPIIQELLNRVVGTAQNGRIHVSAERYRDIIVLEIQERNNYNGYALAYSIHSLEPLARTAGGYIHIKDEQRLEATISFSFPDQSIATGYEC